MSTTKLEGAIQGLSGLPEIRARHIDALRVAAGNTVNDDERALVDEFVRDSFGKMKDKAQRRVVSRFATTLPSAAKLEAKGQQKLDVAEASGIAPLSGNRSLVVDDAKGIYIVDDQGDSDMLLSAKDFGVLKDLEGIAVDDAQENAYVVSEATRTVYRIKLDDSSGKLEASAPEALGKLPQHSSGTCNGWEGLEVVPGRFLRNPAAPASEPDPPDALVCVHEAAPTRISFVSFPDNPDADGDMPVIREFKVPNSAAPHILDISDVTIDPTNGHLFLLSDRSQTIVEFEPRHETQATRGGVLEHTKLHLIGVTQIPDADGTKPEGIGFDPDNGQMVVASEKGRKSRVQRFDVNRST